MPVRAVVAWPTDVRSLLRKLHGRRKGNTRRKASRKEAFIQAGEAEDDQHPDPEAEQTVDEGVGGRHDHGQQVGQQEQEGEVGLKALITG